MEVFIDFLIFIFAYLASSWLMKKFGVGEKLFKRAIRVKAYKFILIILFFVFMFLLECGKQWIYELYGRKNALSIIFAGILGSIYLNCIPYIFKKRIE